MSKRRATHRHLGSHRGPRRRATRGLTGLAVLATTAAVAGPVAFLIPGATDTGEAGRRTAVAASPSAPFPDPTLKGERPDGEVAVGRDRDPDPKRPPSPATRIPERGPGTFEVAAASSLGSQAGVTYRVEVEQGLPFSTMDVARLVEVTLADQRGWATRHTLVRVEGHADLRIILATPETADDLCAPLDTDGRLSCRNGGQRRSQCLAVAVRRRRLRRGACGISPLRHQPRDGPRLGLSPRRLSRPGRDRAGDAATDQGPGGLQAEPVAVAGRSPHPLTPPWIGRAPRRVVQSAHRLALDSRALTHGGGGEADGRVESATPLTLSRHSAQSCVSSRKFTLTCRNTARGTCVTLRGVAPFGQILPGFTTSNGPPHSSSVLLPPTVDPRTQNAGASG